MAFKRHRRVYNAEIGNRNVYGMTSNLSHVLALVLVTVAYYHLCPAVIKLSTM